jgi:hypothetical protein
MKTSNIKSKEDFLKASIKDISTVYSGKEGCRCGCGGEYVTSSYSTAQRSEVNDALIIKRLKRAKTLINKGAIFEMGDTYANLITGKNRVLTFYFDEIK